MSEIADAAVVAMFLTDFSQAEGGGNSKLHSLGVGWQVTVLTATGNTPAQTVVALIDVPQRFAGDQVALELALFDSSGDVVEVPQPDGSTQALRVAQLAVVNRPSVPGVALPAELPARLNIVLAMPGGLNLRPGHLYWWHLTIDGTPNDAWRAPFFIVPPPSPVVIG